METVAETRSAEITQIAQSVTELSRVFKDLASLVIEQGTLLDRIDHNIGNVQENTKQATVQLRKAEEQQRQGSAMKCIFILLALIFLNLLILSAK
jgi:syntaxin 16